MRFQSLHEPNCEQKDLLMLTVFVLGLKWGTLTTRADLRRGGTHCDSGVQRPSSRCASTPAAGGVCEMCAARHPPLGALTLRK